MKATQILLKITGSDDYVYPEMDLYTFIKIVTKEATSAIDLNLFLEFKAGLLEIEIPMLDEAIKLNNKHIIDLGKRLSMISKLKGELKTLKANGKHKN